MIWQSKLVPSMTLVENPREWDVHIETAQVWFNARAAARGVQPLDLESAHPLRVEREILRAWEQTTVLGGDRLELRQVLGTNVAQHFIRYACLLVPSLEPDPWFQERVWSFYDTRKRGKQITNWFGSQNCLSPETLVRRFDGTVCRADEVRVGDKLMGPDSTPRTVTATCAGEAQMYQVTPKVGNPFLCTANHLVSCVVKRGRSRSPYQVGRLFEFTAEDFSAKPQWFTESFGLKTVAVDYPESEQKVDPYVYGLWLGDGDTSGPVLTNADPELADAWVSWAVENGFDVRVSEDPRGNKAKRYAVKGKSWRTNWFRSFLATSVSDDSKFIRPEYLVASQSQRLRLLAGLIDTDGFLAGTFYEVSSSCPNLVNGIRTLAQSLGFRVGVKVKPGVNAWRISICGDIARIPVRLARRVKPPKKQGRGVRKHGVTGFTVNPVGVGPYAGFTVDGDHRFLLADYTVTHNSGKTSSMSVMAIALGCLHPEATRQIATTPFKDVGESPLWTELNAYFEEVRVQWGDQLAQWTGAVRNKQKRWTDPKVEGCCILESVTSKGSLRFSCMPKAGTLNLVAVDKAVAKIQGAKAKDRTQTKGYFLIWMDEIGAGYPTMDILRVLPNVKSNRNFHMITSCNPVNPVGQLDGELGRPLAGFESLSLDRDFVWDSEHDSRTYRFDGHQSPNIVHGFEPKWSYLFTEERREKLLRSYPQDSWQYRSQCRAFMQHGTGNDYVLTAADIRQGYVDQEFEFTADPKHAVAFFDPAVSSDGDKAVYCLLDIGMRREIDGTATPVVWAKALVEVPVFTDKVADAEWVKLCRRLRGENASGNHTLGQVLPVEEYLALTVAQMNASFGVSAANFGYDDSMRSRVTLAMQWAMGYTAMAVSSVGEPEGGPMWPQSYVGEGTERRLVTWKEYCQKFVSQVYFFGAAVVKSGLFRCTPAVMPALMEATKRFWTFAPGGSKRVVESKNEYKKRNGRRSPDNSDALFGAIHVAQKRGLLRLRVDAPVEHLVRGSHRTSPILRQWRDRKIATGLRMTGTK